MTDSPGAAGPPGSIPGPPELTTVPSLEGDALPLSRREVSSRARSAAVLFGLRSAAIRGVGFLSYLVFARFLTPAQLGVSAIGLSIAFFGSFLADGGLVSALIREKAPPTESVMRAAIGFQTAVITVWLVGLVTWGLVARWSLLPLVCTLYVVALLPMAARIPGIVLLERRLEYGPLIIAEIAEVVLFNLVAVTLVVLGAGAVGLGVATIVKSLGGGAVLLRASKTRIMRPSAHFRALRSVLGFGVATQAGQGVVLARDQAINYGTAAIAGLGVLGVWTLSAKIMLLPATVFDSLWRVSFPSFARLQETGEDLGPVVIRSVAVIGVATPLLLVPLAAAGPELIPSVLGSAWHGAVKVLPFLCFSTAVSAPISTVAMGVLLARGEARVVLIVTIALSSAYLAVAFGLLPFAGITALGAGYATGGIVDAVMLRTLLQRRFRIRVERVLARPVGAAILAVLAGRVVAGLLGASLLSGLCIAVVAAVAYAALVSLVERTSVRDAASLIKRTLPGGRSAPAPAA